MKKYFLLTVLLSFLILNGCKKSDDDPVSPSTGLSANIASENFLQNPTGGDPRGTYYPNQPLMSVFYTAPAGVTFTTQFQSTSSGSMKFEGSSATSGTYNSSQLSLVASGTITISATGAQNQVIPISLNSTGIANGTWTVIGTGKMLMDERDTVNYAVNDKGFFMINKVNYLSAGTEYYFNLVMAYKK